VSVAGAANVPLAAVIVSVPETRLAVASESARVNVYPAVLFVLTDTVSELLETTAEPPGVSPIATVPLELTLIVEPTVAVTEVFAVLLAADTSTGDAAIANAATTPAVLRRCVLSVTIFCFLVFFIFRLGFIIIEAYAFVNDM
jgi:hypothetical protein